MKQFIKLLALGTVLSAVAASALLVALVVGLTMLFSMPGRALKSGDELFWRSRFADAELSYQRSLSLARVPAQRARAYTALCRLYRYQQKNNQALSACQAALQNHPNDAEAEAQLARLYGWLGDHDEALLHADRAMQLDPKNPNAAAFYAETLARREDEVGGKYFGRALKFAQYALVIDENNAETYRVLGYIHELEGNVNAAAEHYKRAAMLKPEFFAFYVDLGMMESRRDNQPGALAAFEHALSLSPECVLALQGRGWTRWSAGDYLKARHDFQQAIALNAADSASWAGLGWSYLNEGGVEMANHAFNRALDLNPTDERARIGLESMQVQIQQQAQAAAAAQSQSQQAAPSSQTLAVSQSSTPAGQTAAQIAVASTVQIYAFDKNFDVKSACSGVVISPDGYILTSLHCVADTRTQKPYNQDWVVGIGVVTDPRRAPEKLYRAQTLQRDFNLDVALLKIISNWSGGPIDGELKLSALKIGDSDKTMVGEEVWTAGFPGMGGDTLTLTNGVVSGFAQQNGLPWMKTNLMTGPGNSGGLVINRQGELVGIHIQKWFDQSQGDSRLSAELPINAMRHLLPQGLP